ncbi:MAG: tetratricopeptide repeat protein [Sumerlaeia bacterium]
MKYNKRFNYSNSTVWCGALALVLAVASTGFADRVLLKNGEELSGMILNQDDRFVEIMNENRMVLKLQKSTIAETILEDNALRFEALGDSADEQGKLDEAIANYEKAMEIGGDVKALEAKIEAVKDQIIDKQLGGLSYDLKESRKLRRQERFDAAEETLRKLVEKAPDNKAVLEIASDEMGVLCVARARKLVDNVQHNAAEIQFNRALTFSPNDYRIYEELGDLYSRKTLTHERAALSYLKSLEVGKDRLNNDSINRLHLKVADIYFQNNYFESAARHYRLVYNNQPSNQRAVGDQLIDSLTSLASSGDIKEPAYAIQALLEATEIVPENIEVQELLANLLLESLEYERAIPAFERVLELDANRPDANEQLAFIYRLRRDPQQEAIHLEREVLADPKDYDSKVNYGDVLWRLGDYDKAILQYRNAKDLDPDNPRALVALASSERKLGKYSEAREAIQEILDRFKTDVRANLEMGLVFLDEKNYRRADPYFTDTIEFMKTDSLKGTLEGDTLLANAYVARGEVALNTTGPGTATNDFNKALEIVPDFPPAIYSSGEAMVKKYSSSSALVDLLEAERLMLEARNLDQTNPDFALGTGLFYHKTLSQEDRANEKLYHVKALAQYRDYVNMGGAQLEQVRGFISELESSEREQQANTLANSTASPDSVDPEVEESTSDDSTPTTSPETPESSTTNADSVPDEPAAESLAPETADAS